jgi:uncharacterized protein (DUF2249 family)
MIINESTKIAALIKKNAEVIDAIASINPHFKKLKNPILRRLLASRVSIAEAAQIGKCTIDEFYQKLIPLGFQPEGSPAKTEIMTTTDCPAPIAKAIAENKVNTLDVRPILAGGVDPFNAIMAEIKVLPEGHALRIINSFIPAPLIRVLGKKGFISHVEADGPVFTTYFYDTDSGNTERTMPQGCGNMTLDVIMKVKACFASCVEIDVRDMEMPMPMVTILQELERLPDGAALYVHHKKVPQMLLPELDSRQFRYTIAELGEGDVKLLIYR